MSQAAQAAASSTVGAIDAMTVLLIAVQTTYNLSNQAYAEVMSLGLPPFDPQADQIRQMQTEQMRYAQQAMYSLYQLFSSVQQQQSMQVVIQAEADTEIALLQQLEPTTSF